MRHAMSDTLTPAPWLKIHEQLGVSPPPFDDRPLGTHVELHAAARPDSTALIFHDVEMSYAELNREANTLASKSNDTETTRASVELKVLIEQMREQIQNVE